MIDCFDGRPKLFIERDGGVENAYGFLHGVVRIAKRRCGRDSFQVTHNAHGEIERLRGSVERHDDVSISARHVGAADLSDASL